MSWSIRCAGDHPHGHASVSICVMYPRTDGHCRKLQNQTMILHVSGGLVGRRKRQTTKTHLLCGKIAASSCGGTTSSWAKVQSLGFLSVRHLRNCAVCRKRFPCK